MSSVSKTSLSRPLLSGVEPSFALLAGQVDLPNHGLRAAQQVLKEAGKKDAGALAEKLETCTRRFAAVCQRYEERWSKTRNKGLSPRYTQPAYLKHMAQAMPYRVLMPEYFTAARWPFQFALKDAEAVNPHSASVLGAVSVVRSNQAMLLRQMRRDRGGANRKSASYAKNLAEQNDTLLRPFEAMRKAVRCELLEATRTTAEVIALPLAKAEAQAERRPVLRAALLA